MKKFLFAAVALFIVNGAFAQINFGAKAGVNLANVTDADDASMKFGFHVGGFAEFVINERISIQPELLFSTQGTTTDYKEAGVSIDASLNLNYINVPVLLKVNIAGGLSAEVGPQVGFLLSAKLKEEAMGLSATEDVKDQLKTLDVSLPIGLSYTFAEKFVVGARYAFGLTKISKEGDSKSKNSVIQISFGYKF
ncbi:MAG: PorT family protein [Prevotellaceae bacterium]|jgi:hypothetical protein|nr:PorT family protein [Prevotellaceae bacterium]